MRYSQKKFRPFMKRHNLKDYTNKKEPVIFYGLYRKDVELMENHKSLLVLIWRGSDILQPGHLEAAKNTKTDIRHVAISSFICKDLEEAGIEYTYLPIVGSPVKDIKPTALGNEVYAYIPESRNDFYNAGVVAEIKKRCKYKINISTGVNHYSRKELMNIYKKSFIGLRLCEHDGLPNQVIEMGLMGRKCIYNGDLPGSIKWDKNNIDNIIDNINNESKKIGSINKKLYKKTKKIIDVGSEWLNVEYWSK